MVNKLSGIIYKNLRDYKKLMVYFIDDYIDIKFYTLINKKYTKAISYIVKNLDKYMESKNLKLRRQKNNYLMTFMSKLSTDEKRLFEKVRLCNYMHNLLLKEIKKKGYETFEQYKKSVEYKGIVKYKWKSKICTIVNKYNIKDFKKIGLKVKDVRLYLKQHLNLYYKVNNIDNLRIYMKNTMHRNNDIDLIKGEILKILLFMIYLKKNELMYKKNINCEYYKYFEDLNNN